MTLHMLHVLLNRLEGMALKDVTRMRASLTFAARARASCFCAACSLRRDIQSSFTGLPFLPVQPLPHELDWLL